MELSELKKQAIRVVEGDFNGMAIKVNANAMTGIYCREAASRIAKIEKGNQPKRKGKKPVEPTAVEFFEGRGKEIEDLCELYANLIKGSEDMPLLLGWKLTNHGEAVECSVGELRKLHLELLKELWAECMRTGRPKIAGDPDNCDEPDDLRQYRRYTTSPDTPTDASLTM